MGSAAVAFGTPSVLYSDVVRFFLKSIVIMLSGGTDGAGDNVLLVVIIFSLFPFLFVVE